ncbi:MAG: FKBP-type peptidyl-prolyl cis-trans isomerase [Clostridia bacterium]|nr:FKBP-type peptidyl-prolyl cis-trans isomerase [Clostridia bacterium]
MKKVFRLTAAILAAMMLASCTQNKLPTPSTGDKTTGDVTTTPTTTDAPSTDETVDTVKIYSGPLKENGRYDIKAADYVKIDKDFIKNIVIPKSVHTAGEDDISVALAGILSPFADPTVHLDREIKLGDTVNIDYVGSIDGVEFAGGSTEGSGTDVTIGVTSYIDDFLFQLIGHKAGETVNIEVTFPEDYGKEELNGKDAVFVTKVNYILKTPELTDAFVKENLADYGCETADELLDIIKESITTQAIDTYINNVLATGFEIKEIPEVFIEHQREQIIEYYRDYGSYYGMGLDEFLSAMGTTKEQVLEQSKTECESIAKLILVCQAIAETIGYEAQDTDVLAYFGKLNGTTDITEYKEIYGMPYLKQVVSQDHVINYLKENASRE